MKGILLRMLLVMAVTLILALMVDGCIDMAKDYPPYTEIQK